LISCSFLHQLPDLRWWIASFNTLIES
jgi:hypothetical protein